MSASMFVSKQMPSGEPPSRIPIPSPTPLRRHGSLRFNNKGQQENGSFQSAGAAVLKRGYSFMEKGEKKFGVSPRPQSIKPSLKNGGLVTAKPVTTPQSPNRIRSLSLSLSNSRLNSPKSPNCASQTSPRSPADPLRNHLHSSHNYLDYDVPDWDDTESLASLGGSSVTSCDHASVARNGTTFSGRSMKYVFHCNQHAGQTGEDYLTPTQRAHRQVKKLKFLLQQAKRELEQKDSDILKLTKEVVELRLYKAALSSPEDKSNSSDAVTVRENTSEETSPEKDVPDAHDNNMTNSFSDSGHFEDCTNSSIHSKDSVLFDDGLKSPCKTRNVETMDKSITAHFGHSDIEMEHNKIIVEYERRFQELVKTHEEETLQMKQKHNDKVEELLQRITEINSRYWQLVPEVETARDRIKELEMQLEEASKKLQEQEDRQEQERQEQANKEQEIANERKNRVMDLAPSMPSRISVPELLQELQVTKNELENLRAMYRQLMEAKNKNKIDPEITLQFLKSAVYYFLTDKENSQGHLKAIQSILGFTATEIENIDKARLQ